ncbi:hypothetical protein EIP86_011101 [Pleurotus ostreatoroseus]|nr:hypothetical protein EIP86_011101 [Pleurotus ostreatoroseus]
MGNECCTPDCDAEPDMMWPCERCKHLSFCSKKCRRNYWPVHIFNCEGYSGSYTALQYLAHACAGLYIPTDRQTRITFHFDRAAEKNKEHMLAGLYRGLIELVGETPGKEVADIEEWACQDTLVENIIAVYEGHKGRHAHADYYAWFRNNQWVVDDSLPIPK